MAKTGTKAAGRGVKAPKRSARKTGGLTYTQALQYLDDRVDVEKTRPSRVPQDAFKLDRMRALLDEMGNPQRDVKFVHVAGSKGKGSVCEMVASIMEACGYTVGLFTSPHLVDIRERIRLGGQPIGQQAFARLMTICRDAADAIEKRHGSATYFELLTALGLAYFADRAVDLAVIEVGLGGRLDSTNVIDPEVCAIAGIQLEHTQILGDTLGAIAREKAGIMKAGVTCVTFKQDDEVMGVFDEVAEEVGATVSVLGKDIEYSCRFEAAHQMGPHARVCVSTPRSAYEHLPVPLPGEHQAMNCGLALAVADKLKDRGFVTPEREVALGLAKTPANGRMELVLEQPRIYVDGAHTPPAVGGLMRGMGAHLRYDSMVVVFGCAADKHVDGMLEELARGADKVVFTRSSDNPRAMDPGELAKRFAEICPKMAQVEPTVKDAINTAARAVGREDLICVTGSFWVAGEAKRLLIEREKKKAAKP